MIDFPTDLEFPVLARPKLRGVRAFILNGEAMIRQDDRAISLPNRFVADILSGMPAFDGILVVGDTREAVCSAATHEAMMADNQAPLFAFHVVDLITTGKYPFKERFNMVKEYAKACRSNIVAAHYTELTGMVALEEFREAALRNHYPGIVVRDPETKIGGVWVL